MVPRVYSASLDIPAQLPEVETVIYKHYILTCLCIILYSSIAPKPDENKADTYVLVYLLV